MKNLTHLFFVSPGTTTATTSLKRRLTAEHIIIYKALRGNAQGKNIFLYDYDNFSGIPQSQINSCFHR